MARLLRYLRITWTAACVIVVVLLCALWVRSYWQPQEWELGRWPWRFTKALAGLQSEDGQVMFAMFDMRNHWSGSLFVHHPERAFYYQADGGFYEAGVPHWFVSLFFATLAAAPWFRWRFSLRTLLIGTTLIAAVLGLIVWAVGGGK